MAIVRCTLIALVVVAAAATTPLFAQARGVIAEDYFSLAALSDPHLSPDGTTAGFVITSVDRQQNRRRSALWTVAADGSGAPVAIATSTQSSSYPRWSPDSKSIAFLSARPVAGEPIESLRTQIWLQPLSGGEPRRLTTLLNGVSSFEWSPDGSRLVVVGRSGPSDTAKSPSDVRHYTHLRYKFNDTGWFDDKRTHMWVVDAATGRATQITSGNDWDDSDPHWSPDGRRIAFVSDRSGKAYDGSRDADVWTIDASGGALTKISDHNEADTSPRWSPDGRTIAFIAPPGDRRHPKIWLASSQGGAPSQLAADGLDLIPTNLQWAEGGRAIYCTASISRPNAWRP
jgi:Tol biopolymer transport system component